ncbi:MAG: S41 family peptidase [Planctomycetota bacterium]|nr:S41 family peptidase [Planctomycetota bacterium]
MKRLCHIRAQASMIIGLAVCLMTGSSVVAASGNVELPRFPSISPDGSTIVFSWRGDLWKVMPENGTGHASRLTSHPANELRSAWSADGRSIAFSSDRDGYSNIYLMNSDGTNIRRVTNTDRPCFLSGFGIDEHGDEVILLDANREYDTYRSNRPYAIGTQGGDIDRLHDAFGLHPRVSPDGSRVVFSRGANFYGWTRRHGRGPETQDLWLYDRNADTFRQLTQRRGNDGYGKWIDDKTILYMSDREGDAVNLYRMDVGRDESSSRRLTDFGDQDVHWFDVSADGSTAVLHVWDALYIMNLKGDAVQFVQLTITASEDEKDNYEIKDLGRSVSEAALSPDGKVMATISYGEVLIRNMEDNSTTYNITQSHARESGVAWSPDGLKLYFTSDSDGTDSIYEARVTLTRGELKDEFKKITDPEAAEEEDAEEEEDEEAQEDDEEDDEEADTNDAPANDDGISGSWSGTADIPQIGAMPFSMNITFDPSDNSLSGSADNPQGTASLSGTYDPDSGAVSIVISAPDGSSSTLEGTVTGNSMSGTGEHQGMAFDFSATRTSTASDQDADEDEKGDKKKDEDLPKELDPSRWQDGIRFEISPLIATEHHDRDPNPSPDGTKLAFRRGTGNIFIRDLATGEEHQLIEGWDWGIDAQWSPDSRYMAYAQDDMDFNTDVFIVPVDGSAPPINITRHPDIDGSPRWSADGKILALTSNRINNENDVWVVYLDPSLTSLTPKEMEQYFKDAKADAKKRKPLSTKPDDDDNDDDDDDDDDDDKKKKKKKKKQADPIEDSWDLETAYLRLRRMTRHPGGEFNLAMTPGGDRIIYSGNADGFGLYSIKWDGTDRKKLGGGMNVQEVSLKGDKITIVSGGRAGTVGTSGGSVEYVTLDADIRIDLERQSSQKFYEMARGIGETFYHPTMKDLDWDALTRQYHQLALKARTANEFNYVSNRMLGELCASHLGVRSPGSGINRENVQSHGRFGAQTERIDSGYRVTDLIADGPGTKGDMALKIGDVITGIELESFEGARTLESTLEGRTGVETIVTIRRVVETEAGEQDVELNLLLTPGSYGQVRQLAYLDWRNRTVKKVEELSDGRIGYIHIQGMNQASLDVFERDLFAACEGKDGLLIDVRNNGGGSTADRVLASIMVRPHAYTIPRGADPKDIGHYPRDRLFIQRYSLPTNMLCNEKSFSNAEIVSHAFKNLGRGTLVGQETWGGVISTGGFGLIDGTSVRQPFRGWYVMDGSDMENKGAMPDIIVTQTPESEVSNDDEQLKAAVDDLMKRLE